MVKFCAIKRFFENFGPFLALFIQNGTKFGRRQSLHEPGDIHTFLSIGRQASSPSNFFILHKSRYVSVKRFFYLKLADTIARYKSRNLRSRNRIGRLKNRNLKRTDTIGRYKNRNLTSTDCIVRLNRKIESVSEDRSIGPFAHLWFEACTADFSVSPLL